MILTGLSGLVLPAGSGPMSQAAPYDLFHIAFGALGLALAFSGRAPWMRAFNAGFGVIDLYQLAASRLHWFPERWFLWTRADDALHLLIGLALVAVAALGA